MKNYGDGDDDDCGVGGGSSGGGHINEDYDDDLRQHKHRSTLLQATSVFGTLNRNLHFLLIFR